MTTFDRIIARSILLAVAIAILASFTTRAHGATTDCPKPLPHKRHHKLPKAPEQTCVASPPALLAPSPDPEPITAPIVVTRYQTIEPAPFMAPEPIALTPTAWVDWNGGGGFGFVDFSVPASIRNTYVTVSNSTTFKDSYSYVTNNETVNNSTVDYHPDNSVTTITTNSMVNNSTVTNTTNSKTVIIEPFKGGPHKAPELSAAGLPGTLTLLGGLLCVLRGRRHGH